MSRRRADVMYAGARGKATLQDAVRASARHTVQPKADGWLCTLTTDSAGIVANMITRTGQPIPAAVAAEFRGVTWIPNSAVVGELEVGEVANRVSAIRGYRMLHLFDALRVYGQDVTSLPYGGRRDWLMRGESWLVGEDRDRPWTEDSLGAAHDPRTGRYVRPTPRGWRRLRVVPQMPARFAERAWADWVAPGDEAVEGLVLVDTAAPLGKGKRKVKIASTLDVVAVKVDAGGAVCHWVEADKYIAVGHRKGVELVEGCVYEIVHEGFYDSGEPKFARLQRARPDLGATP